MCTLVPAVNYVANGSGQIIVPGLGAGSYTNITVTQNGCTATFAGPVTIISPPPPTASAGPNQSLIACSVVGVAIGGSPTASGGNGSPLITIHGHLQAVCSDPTASNPTVVGIGSPTTYTVLVTDANGCTATSSVTVTVTNPTIAVTITSTSAGWCSNSGGSSTLTANVTGGVGTHSPIFGQVLELKRSTKPAEVLRQIQ